jgi:predicted RNase H-like HicB family nuclease
MVRLSLKDKQLISELRRRFPYAISVRVRRSADGGFVADFTDFPGLCTEAETFSELIDMVNDAVWTYFEVPGKYRSFMPNYIPPLRVAQDLDAFPVRPRETHVRMTRISRAETPCTR